jgi:VanZ family protein
VTAVPRRGARVVCAALLVLWCAALWKLSSEPDPEDFVGVRIPLNDKVEHGLAYAAGGALAVAAFGGARRVPPWAAAILFCGTWGISDEIHQGFVPGRESSAADVAADLAGASAGALALAAWLRRSQTSARRDDEEDVPTPERRGP